MPCHRFIAAQEQRIEPSYGYLKFPLMATESQNPVSFKVSSRQAGQEVLDTVGTFPSIPISRGRSHHVTSCCEGSTLPDK